MVERALADLLSQPGIETGYRQLRATVSTRVGEARGLIGQHFPERTRVTDPRGGFILWVELPRSIDSLALSQLCLAENIVIAPGKMFSATNRFDHCIRLGSAEAGTIHIVMPCGGWEILQNPCAE